MTKADDLRETIRALEIKAGVQRGHLQTTENELARLKRELSKLTRKKTHETDNRQARSVRTR